MRTAQDFVDYIEYCGLGEKGKDSFTSADQYDINRPMTIVVKETQSSKAADVTINADYLNLNIRVSGNYNKSGDNKVLDKATAVYKALRIKTDLVINGRTYYYVQALTPPLHTGFDEEKGVSTYEFNVEVMRRLSDGN